MRALRLLGNAILWVVAVVGVLSIVAFGATRLGYIKPLVVISGSMEPKIMTGDLLIDTPHQTSELRVGDVASIPSAVTGKLISHRVVAVKATDGHYAVNLKGDANKAQDGETYAVGDTVWRPAVVVPNGGYVITTLTKRSVAVPLGIALLALMSMSWFGDAPARRAPDDDEAATAAEAAEVLAGEPDEETAVLASAGAVVDAATPRFPDRIADLSRHSDR